MKTANILVYSLILLSVVFAVIGYYFDAPKLIAIAVILLDIAFAVRIGVF